jgi:hypothetical protein
METASKNTPELFFREASAGLTELFLECSSIDCDLTGIAGDVAGVSNPVIFRPSLDADGDKPLV